MKKIYINKNVYKIFDNKKNDNIFNIELHGYLKIDKRINTKSINEFNIFSDHIDYNYIKQLNSLFDIEKIILHLYTIKNISNVGKNTNINNIKLIYYFNDKNINNLYNNVKFIDISDIEVRLMNNINKSKTIFLFDSQIQMLNKNIKVVKEQFKEVEIHRETIMLTNDCNFNCKYCYQKHLNNNLDFSLFKIRLLQILESCFMKDKNKIVIRLFGGEPLLSKESIIYICELFKFDTRIDVQITTNGYLIDNFIDHLNKLPNLFLSISFDGIENSNRSCSFDANCNEKVLDNIVLISDKFNVQIIYSIYRNNYNDVKNYINKFNNMNINLININCINENISKLVKQDLNNKSKNVMITYKNNNYSTKYKFNKSNFENLKVEYFTLCNGFIYSDVNDSCSFKNSNERYLLKDYDKYPVYTINNIESNNEVIVNDINNYLF